MNDDDISGIIGNAREALDLIEEVAGKVSENTATDNKVDLDNDMVRSAVVTDDHVRLTADVGDISVDEVSIGYLAGNLQIGLGKDKIVCNVPDNVMIGKLELSINNGVLEATLPREGGEE